MVRPASPLAWRVPPDATEIVAKRDPNAKYFLLSNNQIIGVFGHGIHYEASPGVWEETDWTFVPRGFDYVMDRTFFQVRVTAAGVEVRERSTGRGVRWTTPARAKVNGSKARFDKNGLTWEYRVSLAGLKLLAQANTARGPQTYGSDYELLGGASDFTIDPEGNALGDGFTVPRSHIVGADGLVYLAGPWRLDEDLGLAFDFDDSELPAEAFPYSIDPTTDFDIATSVHDAIVQNREANSNAWPPTTFFQANSAAGNITPERSDVASFHSIQVGLMRWDTSSLADNAVVSGVDLELRINTTTDADNRSLTFDWYDFVTAGSEDMSTTALTDAHAGTDITGIATAQIVTFAMIAVSNVNLTGFTGLRAHISGGDPPGANQVDWRAIDNATGDEPRLKVTFTVPAPLITSVTPAAGPIAGGNEVTIFGTDLDGATSVTFGGTEVTSIDSNTATRITVTVASHALGLVDVVVTTAGGSDTEANAYDFLSPTITSIVPDSGPSVGGTSVTITGTDLDNASSVTFGGALASDLFAGVNGEDLTLHTSDTGEGWSKISSGGSIFINTVSPPSPPHARSSSSVLNLYQWGASGANGILQCDVNASFGGGGTNSAGLFFRTSSQTSYWNAMLEVGPGATDAILRLQSVGGGATDITVTIVGKLLGELRVEFSGADIKVFFDDILKIEATDSFNQTVTGLGLARKGTGSSRLSVWDNLSFVDGAEITSNSTTEIVCTTPAGPVGLVDVIVTNPGGATTETDGYTYQAAAGTGGLLSLIQELLL